MPGARNHSECPADERESNSRPECADHPRTVRTAQVSGHQIVITRPAKSGERDLLARLCVGAASALPIGTWLAPDPRCRASTLGEYAWAWVERGIEAGALEVAETSEGSLAGVAAWWLVPAIAPEYERRLAASLRGEALARFETYDEVVGEMIPLPSHLFLGFVAVWPNCRRRGYGSELLRRRHADLDASRIPAVTVVSMPGARRFLLANGYRDSGPAVTLPDGPEMQPMVRQPERAAGS